MIYLEVVRAITIQFIFKIKFTHKIKIINQMMRKILFQNNNLISQSINAKYFFSTNYQ